MLFNKNIFLQNRQIIIYLKIIYLITKYISIKLFKYLFLKSIKNSLKVFNIFF